MGIAGVDDVGGSLRQGQRKVAEVLSQRVDLTRVVMPPVLGEELAHVGGGLVGGEYAEIDPLSGHGDVTAAGGDHRAAVRILHGPQCGHIGGVGDIVQDDQPPAGRFGAWRPGLQPFQERLSAPLGITGFDGE